MQELTPNTCLYIEAKLPQYQLISAGSADRDYFTATLLRKYRVYSDSHRVIEYRHSAMMRNLLCVEVRRRDGLRMLLLCLDRPTSLEINVTFALSALLK